MNSKLMLNKILAVIMVAIILSSCNLKTAVSVPTAVATTAPTAIPTAAAPTDTLAPTIDQNLVNTQAAQTAAASMTLNAPTATSIPPTSTFTAVPVITQTFTPLPPTATPTVTYIYVTKTSTPTPIGYACSVISTSPTTAVVVSTAFNFSWVIKNTGHWLWGHSQADLKWIDGTKMQTAGDLYDLTADVAPNAKYTATIAMLAPSSAGTYTADWQIVQEGALVCSLSLSVKVTN
jgi:hypothetical protein